MKADQCLLTPARGAVQYKPVRHTHADYSNRRFPVAKSILSVVRSIACTSPVSTRMCMQAGRLPSPLSGLLIAALHAFFLIGLSTSLPMMSDH